MSKRNAKTDEPMATNSNHSYCRYCGSHARPGDYMCDTCKTWRNIVRYGREVVKPRLERQYRIVFHSGPIPELRN